MQKYADEWVENKTIYAYVTQSGCSCCGMSVTVNLSELYAQCSDVEAATEGISSWPPVITEQVWRDRVRFRRVLKARNPLYAQFWREHGPAFTQWWRHSLKNEEKSKLCSWREAVMHAHLNNEETYGFGDAYKVVLHAVLEQIQNFHWTKYPLDGPTAPEQCFEEHMVLMDGVWCMKPEYWAHDNDDDGDGLLARIPQMGTAHLLSVPGKTEKKKRNVDDDDDEVEDGDGGGGGDDGTAIASTLDDLPKRKVQSFKADRRLIRLTITRYFIDQCIDAFHKQASSSSSSSSSTAATISSSNDNNSNNEEKS